MATFTFPSIEASYGLSKSSKPTIKSTKFGDGYQAFIRFGMNQNPKTWNPIWNNVTEAQADSIEGFLDARASDTTGTNTCFNWTPPNESSSSVYICLKWSKKMSYPGYATITATFQEVFEP